MARILESRDGKAEAEAGKWLLSPPKSKEQFNKVGKTLVSCAFPAGHSLNLGTQ